MVQWRDVARLTKPHVSLPETSTNVFLVIINVPAVCSCVRVRVLRKMGTTEGKRAKEGRGRYFCAAEGKKEEASKPGR